MERMKRTGTARGASEPVDDREPIEPIDDDGRRRCTAHSSRTGKRCKKAPMKGLTVCLAHGGGAPQVAAAAKRRVVEQEAAAELARLDVEPLNDPLSQLALLAAQAVAWKDAMAARVNALTSLRYEGTGSGEQLRAEVALWERALDRCEKFCTSMARLNIDERIAEISQTQSRIMVSFVAVALARFGIDFHDEATQTIVMALFDEVVEGRGQEVRIIEPIRGPERSAVCEMGMHERCLSYMQVPGMPPLLPWPQRCPCQCHDPARESRHAAPEA